MPSIDDLMVVLCSDMGTPEQNITYCKLVIYRVQKWADCIVWLFLQTLAMLNKSIESLGEEVNRGRLLRGSMARPAQVEFQGQKRQRKRIRGTKQANLDTQKRRAKTSIPFSRKVNLYSGNDMDWEIEMGTNDPVTKTTRLEKGSRQAP